MKSTFIFILFFIFLSISVNGQAPIPLTAMARSANPLMTIQTNSSRYQNYQYFTTAWGDTLLNFMQANPNWLGTYLPAGAVNIAAAGNNLQFTQGGTLRWTSDTTSLGEWIPQFTVSPALSGGLINQRLIGVGSLANKYIGISGQDNVGLYVDGYPDLYLRNNQVQDTALAAGVYEAEFNENGKITYVLKPEINQEKIWYVSTLFGDNQTGELGNPNKPLASISAAIDSTDATEYIYVFPGTYSEAFSLNNEKIIAAPNTNIGGFTINKGYIYSEGIVSGTLQGVTYSDTSKLTIICDSLTFQAPNISNGTNADLTARSVRFNYFINDIGSNKKRLNINCNNLYDFQVGDFGSTVSNLDVSINCDLLSISEPLIYVGGGNDFNNNAINITAGNLFYSGSTLETFAINAGAGDNFSNNNIFINIKNYKGNAQVFGSNFDNLNILNTAANSSSIYFKFDNWHYTGNASSGLIGVESPSTGNFSNFVIEGNFISDSTELINIATLNSGFTLKGTAKVLLAGKSVINITTLNVNGSKLNIELSGSNDGTTPKVAIATPTTLPNGAFFDLDNNSVIDLSYRNTRNDTGLPVNMYATSSTGVRESHPLSEVFAIYNSQASSDLELVSTADSTTAYPLFSTVTKTNTDFYENQGDTVIFFKQPGVYRIDAGLIFETSGSTQSVNTILKFEPAVSYGRSFSIDANGDRTSHAYNAVITVSTPYTKLRISKQTGAIATTTFFGSDSRITIQRVY